MITNFKIFNSKKIFILEWSLFGDHYHLIVKYKFIRFFLLYSDCAEGNFEAPERRRAPLAELPGGAGAVPRQLHSSRQGRGCAGADGSGGGRRGGPGRNSAGDTRAPGSVRGRDGGDSEDGRGGGSDGEDLE